MLPSSLSEGAGGLLLVVSGGAAGCLVSASARAVGRRFMITKDYCCAGSSNLS
jgi:hypothetical protein